MPPYNQKQAREASKRHGIADLQSAYLYDQAGEPIPGKNYLKSGWIYREVPFVDDKHWTNLIMNLQEEVVVMARSSILMDNGKKFTRGTILISPSGVEIVKEVESKQNG